MSDAGLVVSAGRILKGQLLAGLVTGPLSWCGIGNGDWADKDNPPLESDGQTGLLGEIARKQVTRIRYLVANTAGTITFNGVKYNETTTPGDIIAFITVFENEEIIGATITEQALFGGTIVTNTTPLALVADVVTPGTLYWVQNRPQFQKTNRDQYTVIGIFRQEK